MKKTATLLIILALCLSLLSGCFRLPKNIVEQLKPDASDTQETSAPQDDDSQDDDAPDDSQQEDDVSEAPPSLTSAKNPSEGYQNYMTVKSEAIERISKAAEDSPMLQMTVGMSIFGYSMMDLSLIWLTVFASDLTGSEAAMAMLGMKNVKITENGGGYTITYKDADGNSVKQTCQFDAGKDQLTSTLYDKDNNIQMFFEYVNLGNHTYAAQYYYPSGDELQIVRSYFDTEDVAAFGTINATEEPASILGKSGLDEEFVKNDESYCILKDGKLTVFVDGEASTN